MTRVRSSVIQSIGYNNLTAALKIKFKSGSTYSYRRVPEEVYEAFLNASSKGKFFNQYIKGIYG